jgi:hypothetical protein
LFCGDLRGSPRHLRAIACYENIMSDPHQSGSWRKNAGPAAPAETKLLQGPRPRTFELGSALRIFREIIYGFR